MKYTELRRDGRNGSDDLWALTFDAILNEDWTEARIAIDRLIISYKNDATDMLPTTANMPTTVIQRVHIWNEFCLAQTKQADWMKRTLFGE